MTDTAADRGASPTYLVVLRHVLVAQDIAMTVAEFDPGARVVTAANAAEALPMMEGVERIAVAFVGSGPEGFRASPLARAVAERGGRIVLLGEEAEAAGAAAGFQVLVRPFTTGGILRHLADGG